MAAAFVLAGAHSSITIAPAPPSTLPSLATFYVQHRWAVRHVEDVADLLGDKAKTRLADTAQLPMRLNADSDAGSDAAYGGLTALQRELLERQTREEFEERFVAATERLPAELFVASDDSGATFDRELVYSPCKNDRLTAIANGSARAFVWVRC